MYAIVEAGGRQLKVSEGDRVNVEKMEAATGSEVKLDKVVALINEDGSVFGSPYISGAYVNAEVAGSGKGDKILVYKQKPRKGHRKLNGHRQQYTTLAIKGIQKGD
ncbi:MAG: 50S ribosomal protein L21 [Thermodesulfovibrionales bacterium]|nr:50S ribosomal protein L21 [Thermodesulfovibrionales bacterium]